MDENIEKENVEQNERKIIITRYYYNYTLRFIYIGKAIFDDGSIYGWNYIGHTFDFLEYNLETEEGLKKYILEKGKLVDRIVKEEDLKKMKEYIEDIENVLTFDYFEHDRGVCNISVWKDNQETIIKSMGDCSGENESESSKKLLKLIDKYV